MTHDQLTAELASRTAARDALSDELKRIESSLDRAGATQFDDSVDFIDRLAARASANTAVAMLAVASNLISQAEESMGSCPSLATERELLPGLRSDIDFVAGKIGERMAATQDTQEVR